MNEAHILALDHALRHLSPNDLARLGQVSKHFKTEANKEVLWKGFFPPWYKATVPNWKIAYLEYLRKPAAWVKSFHPPKFISVNRGYIPETDCIRIMYHPEYPGKPVFYLGSGEVADLMQVAIEPDHENKFYTMSPIVGSLNINTACMAHHETLLAAGGRDKNVYLINTTANKGILSKESVIGKMELSGEMPEYGQCSWMHNPITQLSFANSGKVLFSSSPMKLNGVTMWDVETQKAVHTFNHHTTGDWEMEKALYGTRSKHEIYSVCPAYDGTQFFSGSYDLFYHWDTRSGELIKSYPLYEGDQGNMYELSNIHLINNESELLVYGRRPSRIMCYDLRTITPSAKQFEPGPERKYMPEFYGLDFSDRIGFGADGYGSFTTFDCTTKELKHIQTPDGCYIGSGSNGVHISDTGATVGISMSNPGSGYFRVKMVAMSTEDLFIPIGKKKKGKCTVQ